MLMRIGVDRQNSVNISTIEDPVEFKLPRVNQVQINPAAGVTFASSLRAFLRQDPDVIMAGEIRDGETADLAVRAALVGRLLLTTLHTNDAASALPRLLDIGVEPYLLASTLTLVAGQRLVRRICGGCRESIALDADTLAKLRTRPDFGHTVVSFGARASSATTTTRSRDSASTADAGAPSAWAPATGVAWPSSSCSRSTTPSGPWCTSGPTPPSSVKQPRRAG